MKPGTVQGTRLSLRDRRAIRHELLSLARQTGSRAYTFRFDGDVRVEFRAWPDGRWVVSRVNPDGTSVEPPRRVLAVGATSRAVGGVVVAALALLDALLVYLA